jgi:phenylacetate-coenzyme A ligase PaaK-like adenylate-forming protein
MLNNVRAYRQVMRDVRLSGSKLDKVVRKRMQVVLASAYRDVPYYRDMMQRAGCDPIRDYRGPQDLVRLPITTKKDLKESGTAAFVREGSDLSRCFTDITSGSTGIPLRIYRGPYERAIQIAKWLRVLFLNGYSIRHRVMALVAPERVNEGSSPIQRLGILRRLTVDYDRPCREMVDLFLAYRPDVLYGNRSHLDLLALELGRRGIQAEGLKLLVGTAEGFRDSNRQLYREQLGVEMVESYGSIEMGVMAHETQRRDGLQLCEDLTYFEFLDEDGRPVPAGTAGRVVVTDLTGRLMPFIRYDQGDLAVFEYVDSENGTSSRRIKEIVGREDDYALLPDGTRYSFHIFVTVMNMYEGITRFRIVQKTQGRFEIRIVADADYIASIRDDLVQHLREEFPLTVSFEVVQVDHIDPDPSGKSRMLVSEVD